MINKRFNRIEGELDNIYISQYGSQSCFNEKYNGYVKCKLIHSKEESLIFADQIFLPYNESDFHWVQPLTFFANLLIKDGDVIFCMFYVDISMGKTLKITFTNKEWICNFEDNSSLFKCDIYGPPNIHEYATGDGYFLNHIPYLKLFHHTTSQAKSLILKSDILKPSRWNIQGTKCLTNVHYSYFTCLDKIKSKADLQQIAMASDGIICLTLDNKSVPPILDKKDSEKYKDCILQLQVYRGNTYDRKATIEFIINATLLSPRHLWKHLPKDQFAFYEICMPFVYRIGVNPDCSINIKNKIIDKQDCMKIFDYQVVGVAADIKGLEAPFDEENTEYLFKIEPLTPSLNILNFWFENGNSNLYSNKNIDMQEFEK